MIKELWCTDQGDTSSSDWLEGKEIIGFQVWCWIPIKLALTFLLTTCPPINMSVFTCVDNHPIFKCIYPFNDESVTHLDNTQYAGSTINSHEQYLTPYLMGNEWRLSCCQSLTFLL